MPDGDDHSRRSKLLSSDGGGGKQQKYYTWQPPPLGWRTIPELNGRARPETFRRPRLLSDDETLKRPNGQLKIWLEQG